MKPYKLKHVPTGLYYQPLKHRGSNFSKRGKIYQTNVNILSLSYYSNGKIRDILTIFANEDTIVYKEFKNILVWEKSQNNNFKTATLATDWVKEEI
jgi:hypothetical protein